MANLAMKDKARVRFQEPDTDMDHYYQPDDALI